MFIKQLSVFIENQEGRLEEVLDVLREEQVSIISLSLADTSEYGLLRMITSNPEAGQAALKEKGFAAMLTDVLAVRLSHQVGKLQEILSHVCKAGLNVEYMYVFPGSAGSSAYMVFRVTDIPAAEAALTARKIELVSQDAIERV